MTPLGTLAKRFRRDETVISRIISSSLRSGLVEIRAAEEASIAALRREDIERELLKKYSSLISAVVVNTPAPPDESVTSNAMMQYSDYVHRILGMALAHEICRGTMIRDGDRVGIGPGRGVYETARWMQKQTPVRARHVTLVSLSGVGFLRHHAHNRNLLLDPDFIVAFMGEAFEHPVTLDLVAAPLVCSPEKTLASTAWLRSPGRGRPLLDTAILGIGAFVPGNRFYEEAAATPPSQDSVYGPIRPALRSLRAACARAATDGHVPLADVGYHLFLVPSARGDQATSGVRNEMQRQIDAINATLLSAHRDDFQSMRSAMLVAGTPAKARAIDHVLTSNFLRASHISTDKNAAEILLSL